eukprot:NODE_2602_length_895_cov_61.628842_g2138_i0.p1 GENE.NODE_2602_length_895_cov_61.628842_g2138_i0~~NODE_2602_length_895_cov_61.628842_g2138_i0.p1  ORF type:complete len:116 (-),score=21.12 NODE_2602_length_895_cov_61.628842_g2138_i0:422-769(-)
MLAADMSLPLKQRVVTIGRDNVHEPYVRKEAEQCSAMQEGGLHAPHPKLHHFAVPPAAQQVDARVPHTTQHQSGVNVWTLAPSEPLLATALADLCCQIFFEPEPKAKKKFLMDAC